MTTILYLLQPTPQSPPVLQKLSWYVQIKGSGSNMNPKTLIAAVEDAGFEASHIKEDE